MQSCASATRAGRRGFSLVELIAVMVIISTLAFSAAPAVRSVTSARQGAMSRQLVRLIELARAHATASGQPSGLVYDSVSGSLQLRRIESDGAAPTAMLNPLGGTYEDLILSVEYPSVAVTGFVTGSGNPKHASVWFSFSGTPEVRDSLGGYVSDYTQDVVITTTGGHGVTVRMTTGAIEG